MVIILDQNVRKLRAWIGELPDALYPVTDVVEHIRPTNPRTGTCSDKQVAVEYYRYTEHSLYGLLGGTFIPQESDHLVVQVARSSGAGQEIGWSINPFYGGQIGLWSPSVIDFISEAVLDSSLTATLGPGLLRLDCAVQGPPIVMKWLVSATVVLLSQPADSITEESLPILLEHIGPPYLWFRQK